MNDEDESKEAQELFKQLGYQFSSMYFSDEDNSLQVFADGSGSLFDDHDLCSHQELTLPQLRDLVVLKRKDINDANFTLQGNHYYKSSRGDWYFYGLNSWQHSTLTDLEGIEPIQKPEHQSVQEQGLISGADALRALADGKEVEYNERMGGWRLVDKNTLFEIFLEDQGKRFKCYLFRLKPRTIKLEIEIPAPFEPKDDDRIWVLDVHRECGYGPLFFNSAEPKYTQFGAWDSEEKVKAVVAALMGIKG